MQLNRLILTICGLALITSSALGQHQNSSSARHQIRSMALEVLSTRGALRDCESEPQFRICENDHFHWSRGLIAFESPSLAMWEQVSLEWYWRHVPANDRVFWTPYVREVNRLIAEYIARPDKAGDYEWSEVEEYYSNRIDEVYRSGAEAYARLNGATLKVIPAMKACSAPDSFYLILNSASRAAVAIKWIDAGTVWLKVQTTGVEPEYQTIYPGGSVSVYPGSLYYYKIVLADGRESRRLLAPPINGESGQLTLAWR